MMNGYMQQPMMHGTQMQVVPRQVMTTRTVMRPQTSFRMVPQMATVPMMQQQTMAYGMQQAAVAPVVAPMQQATQLMQPMNAADLNRPTPEVFSIMRNGHEVIRGLMKDCEMASDMLAFRTEWVKLMKWQELHAMQEDGASGCKGFFAVLDERFQNMGHQRGLHQAHHELQPLEQQINQMISNPQMTLEYIKPVYMQFMQKNEEHLKNEEDVMMPSIKQMKESGVPLVPILQNDIMPCIWNNPDYPYWVSLGCQTLEKHNGGQPRARVWLHALKTVTPADRWASTLPAVRAGLSPQLYSQINTEIGLEDVSPQQPMGGATPQQPTGGGALQQPMAGGALQQPMAGAPQQPMAGAPQQPMAGATPQQPMGGSMGWPQMQQAPQPAATMGMPAVPQQMPTVPQLGTLPMPAPSMPTAPLQQPYAMPFGQAPPMSGSLPTAALPVTQPYIASPTQYVAPVVGGYGGYSGYGNYGSFGGFNSNPSQLTPVAM